MAVKVLIAREFAVALGIAVKRGSERTVALLLWAGADPHAPSPFVDPDDHRIWTEAPAGFRFRDGKAQFEAVVAKTNGRVRRRRTISAPREREALGLFAAFRQ